MFKTHQIVLKHVSILMVFVLLISSVGVFLDVHYCQGDIQAIGFYSDAPNCYDGFLLEANTEIGSNTVSSSCCKDEFIYGKVNVESKEEVKLKLQRVALVDYRPITINENFKATLVQVCSETDLISKDIRILFQHFLI